MPGALTPPHSPGGPPRGRSPAAPPPEGGARRKYGVMGVQGSGKGTQSAMLFADLGMVHISVGDIFRWHVQNHTKLGAQVRRAMNAGELIGDDLVQATVRAR